MKYYSNERSVQILISLLKEHNIRKVVASPGTTNLPFVGSVMYDSWFEIYSSVDERSAAYIAWGLASETGEPVVLSCTGATASRNYFPGLTEAYYRKLPILAVTSTKDSSSIGHLVPQVIDRRTLSNDIALLSEQINPSINSNGEWDANVRINRAILELKHRGGGPVHLNLASIYSRDFSVKELPRERVIRRVEFFDDFPELPKGLIGIFVGAHHNFTKQQTEDIEAFCSSHNAVVFCDHTSGYSGKFKIQSALIKAQENATIIPNLDLLIHIGEVSGDYPSLQIQCKQVWRVNPDGELRDLWHKLTYVFEMPEEYFFKKYSSEKANCEPTFYLDLKEKYNQILNEIPELPFSNTWIAQQTAHKMPVNSVVHLGILNTLRNWNFFEIGDTISLSCNTGGFGIDGTISTLVGASLSNIDKLYFVILGDLAFFYDMNVLGNRHLRSNIRILLINNGKGTEFRNYNHPGSMFGEDADLYIAAGGHYGNKSPQLVKHYAEDLGFEYISATNKEEYISQFDRFVSKRISDKPMLFEVFTNSEEESNALRIISNTAFDPKTKIKNTIIGTVKQVLGESTIQQLKKVIKK